jgi:hypothetical protein
MARLGKKEREAKRALIKHNLNSPREVTPRSMTSYVSTERMLGRTHTGYREPQNAKGSITTTRNPSRWSSK